MLGKMSHTKRKDIFGILKYKSAIPSPNRYEDQSPRIGNGSLKSTFSKFPRITMSDLTRGKNSTPGPAQYTIDKFKQKVKGNYSFSEKRGVPIFLQAEL